MRVLDSPDLSTSFQCVGGQICSLIVTGQDVTPTWVRVMS